jgi:hypothetical protein
MPAKSLYSPELAETICARLEAGKPLAAICRDKAMPGVRTVLQWADENAEFAVLYARAREAQAEWLDAEIQRIAETAKDKNSAAAARVKITALTWRASKQAPKRYGDKIDLSVDHSFDLAGIIDRRRQRVIEANERIGIASADGDDK